MKNIVFIFPDQMRADYLGCYGADFAKTPNIDQLAGEGVVYENACSTSPLCVPARASLLTGKNAIVNGVLENSTWLRPDHGACGIETWPQILSDNGYDTIAVGKMHFYPWDTMEGFDKRIISEDKRHYLVEDDYADYLTSKGLKKYRGIDCEGYAEGKGAMMNPFKLEDQADQWITRQACDTIGASSDDKPFAMMVGFLSPHCPYDPDVSFAEHFQSSEMPDSVPETPESMSFRERLVNAYKKPWAQVDYSSFTEEEKKKVKAHYSACIHDVDVCVGYIVEALKKKGIYDNTVIIFASDHGDFVGDFGLIGKHYYYEPSIHVPLIIKDTTVQASGTRKKEVVNLTDIRATILQIAGIEGIQDIETEDSKILSCYKESTEERMLFGATDIGYMARMNEWKLCRYKKGLTQLFNLNKDPYEQVNLAYTQENMDIFKKLDAYMQKRIVESIYEANMDKIVDKTTSLDEDDYFKRHWKRPYPVSQHNGSCC
ncbi:sulfatase-like hydrolase/transferase [Vallitalea pronyensis]|uniref:Sulfatase-like hydrolase/transferase n=1 Tax=Vallitalea pronyensis TaxID=1348613 RepID=A0A8J8MHV2_9FIRM|nr:sulfatase-like hydrolase/transferase [Vallitalea pronyensis]QUI22112.1 sulfatase-like hydrolase/transferase [Vallitalea pronyensis]